MRKTEYFEGWYFKHQRERELLILIPGICQENVQDEENGRTYGFIQIITGEQSFQVRYPIEDCFISKDKEYIRIGDSVFCRKGIRLDISSQELRLNGAIAYRNTEPLRYPIMGIFRLFPGMECNHEILSMRHDLCGSVRLNGKKVSFHQGTGYIEKDWGTSFPKAYVWLQCNSFLESSCALTVSVADIPYKGFYFNGCICAIHYEGKEYRLATYLGVKILTCNSREIILHQGKYLLIIKLNPFKIIEGMQSHELFAPVKGRMSRTIKEMNYCLAEFWFFKEHRLLFHLTSNKASLEIAN